MGREGGRAFGFTWDDDRGSDEENELNGCDRRLGGCDRRSRSRLEDKKSDDSGQFSGSNKEGDREEWFSSNDVDKHSGSEQDETLEELERARENHLKKK